MSIVTEAHNHRIEKILTRIADSLEAMNKRKSDTDIQSVKTGRVQELNEQSLESLARFLHASLREIFETDEHVFRLNDTDWEDLPNESDQFTCRRDYLRLVTRALRKDFHLFKLLNI